MYKIDFAKQLDEGTGNIVVQGKVVYSKSPVHRVSPEGATRKYDFWGQFVVVKDETGTIGANVTFHEENEKLVNSREIVLKGIIHKYVEDGEQKVSLDKATIVKPEEEIKEQKPQISKQDVKVVENVPAVANIPIVQESQKLIYDGKNEAQYFRQNAIEMIINLVTTKMITSPTIEDLVSYKLKDWIKGAEQIFKYIYNGQIPDNGELVAESKKSDEEKLDNILEEAKIADLINWKKITKFAIDSNIFSANTGIEEIKKLLCEKEEVYDALLEAIKTQRDIIQNIEEQNQKDKKEYTDEIPF